MPFNIKAALEKLGGQMLLNPHMQRSSRLFGKLKQDKKLGVSLMDATKIRTVSPSTTPSGFRSGSDRFYKMASVVTSFMDELKKLGAFKPYKPIRGTYTSKRSKLKGIEAARAKEAQNIRLDKFKTDRRRKYPWEKKPQRGPTQFPKTKVDKSITPFPEPKHAPKDYSPAKLPTPPPTPKITPKPEVAKPQSWYQKHKGKIGAGAAGAAGLAGIGAGAAGVLRGAAKSAENDAKMTQYAPSGHYA